jgi:hypothetical protein
LVASEDIKADYILLKDKPILICLKAHALEFTPNKVCLGCYREIKEPDEEDEEETSSESSEDEQESGSEGEEGDPSKRKGDINSRRTTDTKISTMVCSKCSLPVCSKKCAAQYWHKAFECRLISESGINSTSPSTGSDDSSPSGTLAPILDQASFLNNLIYFRAILLKHVNEKSWDELMSLESCDEGRRDVPNLERTTRVFSLLKKTLGDINHPTINQVYKPDVHKILGILDVNSLHFNISPVDERELEVSAIFPTFSLLENNCCPNVKYYLSPTTTTTASSSSSSTLDLKGSSSSNSKYLFELYCRSSVKIKKGEHLSIAYCNIMMPTDKRKEFLKKERLFTCACPRCEDPTELGSNFSTILCPSPGCPGFSVPTPKKSSSDGGSAGEDVVWKCQKCSKVTQAWQVKKVDSKLCEMVGKTKPNLENYRELLSKMEELVHPDYYLNFVVNHSLIQMYGEDEATVHDKTMLEAKVALSNRLLRLIKILDPGMAKLNIYSAVIYYEMQSAILALAGGEVDDDFQTLRYKPETVKLAKLYLQKCMDCFKYEMLELPENKLKNLAKKKMEYLDFILKARNSLGP